MKFEDYDETKKYSGIWHLSIKIDGVRCHQENGICLSRNGKPLYNIPKFEGIAEIYVNDNFKDTIKAVRTRKAKKRILKKHVYMLSPVIDKRLDLGKVTNPSKEFLAAKLQEVLDLGFEGLILRKKDRYVKIKKDYTIDVRISDFYEGKGRNKGRLGGFITERGRVGSGISDAQRINYWSRKKELLGCHIEVKSMELYPSGKFRQPRFIRLRPDKD